MLPAVAAMWAIVPRPVVMQLRPALLAHHHHHHHHLHRQRGLPAIVMMGRRGHRARAARQGLPPRPKRELQRTPGGVPEIAQCHPERYDELLRDKVAALREQLEEAVRQGESSGDAPLPAIEVFESPPSHFRMRANFGVWREGVDPEATRHLIMFNAGDKMPQEVTSYPMGSRRLNEMMPTLLASINESEVLRSRVNDVRFLTTLKGDALVTITYNRPIDEEWRAEATALAEELGAHVVGRSKGVKLVVGGETVSERLEVPGRGVCEYTQTEGAFTQPNARVCEQMLGWAFDATRGSGGDGGGGGGGEGAEAAAAHDLCELYCGNGCFTVALAPNFRRVVATDLSKASIALAQKNLEANGVANVKFARLSAEEFVEAYLGERHFQRLDEAKIDLDDYELRTLFVDPPRAGLDETCRGLASRFGRVVYVSCNPTTLARDVAELGATHAVTRLAAFDQFPYTPHLECGVVLERRESPIEM